MEDLEIVRRTAALLATLKPVAEHLYERHSGRALSGRGTDSVRCLSSVCLTSATYGLEVAPPIHARSE